MEAGGHRGAFDAAKAETGMVGLFSLLPAVVDAVKVPVIAAGGIADARGVAAALILGASAVQIGTGFLRCPEAKLPPPGPTRIGRASLRRHLRHARLLRPRRAQHRHRLRPRRRGTGRAAPAPYPVQRGPTQPMRDAAVKDNDIARIQAWRPQSGRLGAGAPRRRGCARAVGGGESCLS